MSDERLAIQVNPALEDAEYSDLNAKNADTHQTTPEKAGLAVDGHNGAPTKRGAAGKA
jgi:hypothetical protein